MPRKKKTKIIDRRKILVKVLVRFGMGALVIGALFFLTAGSFNYWNAWAYMAFLFLPMIFVLIYLYRNDPELLDKRTHMDEKRKTQKAVIYLGLPLYMLVFILPGLDWRYGWSVVPVFIALAADMMVFLGYLLFILVMRENSFASRVVEVQKGQKVIATGPYALVRHPMYLGGIIIYVFSPIALGSWWSLLAAVPIPVLLIIRLLNEEKLLVKSLPGYRSYMNKVRYRLIPGVW